MALQINQKKYNRQCLGQQRFKEANGWGAWWWQTGIGKTFAAIDMMRKMVIHNDSYTFYIVVPSPVLQKQWMDEIKANIPQDNQPNFSVLTIHKVVEDFKETGRVYECTTLILDESHEYYTEERIGIFFGKFFSTRWLLALTANYEDVNGRYKLIQLVVPVVDKIDTEEAVREGYISKYIEYNLGVYLTPLESQKYDELSDKISKNLSKFGRSGLELANKVLEGVSKKDYSLVYQIASSNGWRKDLNKSIPRENEIEQLWGPGLIIGYASNSLNAIRERKNIIYNATNKLKIAVDIVTKFHDLKTICFSQTTVYADALYRQINQYYRELNPQSENVCTVYHSNLQTIVYDDPVTGKQKKKGKTILKREAIEGIRTGKYRIVSTASSLDKGFDVPDIRLSLTTSGTQNPTQYNQRKGRAVRVEDYENEDIIVLIVNVYARGTIDEKWLKTRQSKTNNVIYYVDRVEDINYTPRKKETFNILKV